MTDKALLTVREYAAEARVTERTVRRWITEGRLRALRQGKKYLIPSEESASAQIGSRSRPSLPGAAKPVGEGALKYLLFWICDAWVDGGEAQQTFAQDNPAGAERYFQNLVAEIDQEAAQQVDTELALRLRFIARDLLANLNQLAAPAEAAAPTDQAATALPVAPTTPLQTAAAPTRPLGETDQ